MEQIGWLRRDVLGGLSATTGAAILAASGTSATAQQVTYSSGTEPAKLKVPANACDCHHHIYGSRYKVDPRSTLRPGDASVDDYRTLQKRIGTSRNVIVQPSTYGTENAPTLDALVAFGPSARAVVVVRAEADAGSRRTRHPLQPGAGRSNHARDDRAAVKAGQRPRLAYPDQRLARNDHGNHADPRKSAVADRVRPPRPHSRTRWHKPSAVWQSPRPDRQGQDLGQIVWRLCRHQSGPADLRRLARDCPRLR